MFVKIEPEQPMFIKLRVRTQKEVDDGVSVYAVDDIIISKKLLKKLNNPTAINIYLDDDDSARRVGVAETEVGEDFLIDQATGTIKSTNLVSYMQVMGKTILEYVDGGDEFSMILFS